MNLTKCYQIKQIDFKNLLKYFKRISQIEKIFLNYCGNLTWTNGLRSLKFESLHTFDILSVKIDFVNLLDVVNNLKLKEIAFSLPVDIVLKKKNSIDFNGFSNIEDISIELRAPVCENFYDMLDHFLAVKQLELFAKIKINLNFSFDSFKHQFRSLKSFVASGNIYFTENTIFNSLRSLKDFHVNIYYNCLNFNFYDQIKTLNEHLKLKNFKVNITNEFSYENNSQQVIRKQRVEIDDFFDTLCSQNFIRNLEKFELSRSIRFECLLTSISNFKSQLRDNLFLKTVDFRDIHLHSSESICQTLANLECKKNEKNCLFIHLLNQIFINVFNF